jgi:hypothetical protein
MTLPQLAFVIGTLTVLPVVYWMNGRRQGPHLPPGPKKLPFVGNLLSMPSTLEWETFARWGEEHSMIRRTVTAFIYLIPFADSDIIHVNALGKSIIILNSYKVATDLLDARSSIYSSR